MLTVQQHPIGPAMKSKPLPPTASPTGSEFSPVLQQLQHLGLSPTVDNYLALAGISSQDLASAEVRSSLPRSIRLQLEEEEARDRSPEPPSRPSR